VVLIECYKLSKNVVQVVLKKWSDLSLQSGQSWPKNGSDFTLNIGPSRPGKVVPDFTLNIGPSCPQKVVWVVFKKWSELSYQWFDLSRIHRNMVTFWHITWTKPHYHIDNINYSRPGNLCQKRSQLSRLNLGNILAYYSTAQGIVW
jgi:hypothetical protein